MLDTASAFEIAVMHTLGLSILEATLKTAAKFIYLKNTANRSETRECYTFIQGTGLDILIMEYDLDVEARSLRNSFNFYLKRKSHGEC